MTDNERIEALKTQAQSYIGHPHLDPGFQTLAREILELLEMARVVEDIPLLERPDLSKFVIPSTVREYIESIESQRDYLRAAAAQASATLLVNSDGRSRKARMDLDDALLGTWRDPLIAQLESAEKTIEDLSLQVAQLKTPHIFE